MNNMKFYKDQYVEILNAGNLDETYKWEARENFQKYWNLDAENFKQMFDSSLQASSSNIWESMNFYPKKMLLHFIDIDENQVRDMFRTLFDEGRSLDERIEFFLNVCSELLDQFNSAREEDEQEAKQHYHRDMRMIALYLSFRYPNKYFFYKYNEVSSFLSHFFDKHISSRWSPSEKYTFYLEYADKVRDLLNADVELISSYNHWLNRNEFKDQEQTLLTFDFIFQTAKMIGTVPVNDDSIIERTDSLFPEVVRKYWMYAPGEGGTYWNDFYDGGIMAIGWDFLGDLRNYSTKHEIAQALQGHDPESDSSKKNNAVSCYGFCSEIQVGDIVYAKAGRTKILGRGVVTSDYEFDDRRSRFKHVRKVTWEIKGEWEAVKSKSFAIKTLTDVTRYQEFLEYLENLIKADEIGSFSGTDDTDKTPAYWWLNAKPSIWDINKPEIGEKQTYTAFNDKGNKRRVYKYFQQVKPGDIVLGYASSPNKHITAVYTIRKSLYSNPEEGECIELEKTEQLIHPLPFRILKETPELAGCEPLNNNQGSLFSLRPEEYETIRSLIDEAEEGLRGRLSEIKQLYPLEAVSQDTGVSIDKIQYWLHAVEQKGQAVLYGPPGTGKTFISEKLAQHLVGGTNGFYELVQFHPSYTYEDFIQGIRPEIGDQGNLRYEMKDGRFLSFCRQAQLSDGPCVLIIDEINRANLTRVFGELMYLLEYREQAISLSQGDSFSIPKNVRIIGTMNTADRSIALVDFALRRRFAFIELSPDYDLLKDYLRGQEIDAEQLVSLLKEVNDKIQDKNFYLGISFFMKDDILKELETIWRMEIETYLEEYFFSQPDAVIPYRWITIQKRFGL